MVLGAFGLQGRISQAFAGLNHGFGQEALCLEPAAHAAKRNDDIPGLELLGGSDL